MTAFLILCLVFIVVILEASRPSRSTRDAAYKLMRLSNDVRAINKGRAGKRISRRILGRLAGKLIGRITR